jgi:hypothetical protein
MPKRTKMNWKEYREEQHALYLVDTITDMKSNRDLETLEQRRMRIVCGKKLYYK